MLNVLRVSVADKHKLGEFQLSQSYMSFWDKWNKVRCALRYVGSWWSREERGRPSIDTACSFGRNQANYFLEQALELFALGEPLDSRTMKELMKKPVDDGGEWAAKEQRRR